MNQRTSSSSCGLVLLLIITSALHLVSSEVRLVQHQHLWKDDEVIQLMQAPQCQEAVVRARQRLPRVVSQSFCPLCSHNHIQLLNGTHVTMTYLKIPKAHAASGHNNSLWGTHQSACEVTPHNNNFLYSFVRDPLSRVLAAYNEASVRKSSQTKRKMVDGEPDRFIAFCEEIFGGNVRNWDGGGKSHHMMSAALMIQAAMDMNMLPSLLGRMEYLDEMEEEINLRMGKHLSRSHKRFKKNKLPFALNITSVLYDLIGSLWEEDFVCFGYTLPIDGSMISPPSSKYVRIGKLLEEKYWQRNHQPDLPEPSPSCPSSHHKKAIIYK